MSSRNVAFPFFTLNINMIDEQSMAAKNQEDSVHKMLITTVPTTGRCLLGFFYSLYKKDIGKILKRENGSSG